MNNKNKSSRRKTIFLNTSFQVIGKSINLVFILLTTIVLRRYLGREGYGNYSFVLSLVLLFAVLSDFGTRLVTISEASQHLKEQNNILGISLFLRLLFLVFSSFAYLVFSFLIPVGDGIRITLLLAVGLLTVFFLRDSLYMVFTTKMRLAWQTVVESVGGFLVFFTAFITTVLHKDLTFLFVTMTIFSLGFFIIFWKRNKYTKLIRLNFNYLKAISLIRKSSLVFASLFVFSLSSQTPFLALKLLNKPEALGIFSLSYKVYENAMFPAALYMNACLPFFGRLIKKKHQENKQFLQNAYDSMFIFALVVAVGMFLFAPLAIRIITGNFLHAETISIQALAILIIFAYINHFYGFLFLGLKLYKEIFYAKIVGLITALPFLLLLINHYSYLGAILFIFIIEITVMFYSFYVGQKKLHFTPVATRFPQTFIKILKSKGGILLK